jgi:alkylhydroperoxidase family enzyme
MNRLMTVPAIPVASVERVAQHWALGWVAPFARLVMRRRWRRGGVTVLPVGLANGPWSAIVRALDGLPAARGLRSSIDEALASEVLPRRAKALVFAVVARGLDCGWACEEAMRLLEETGLTPGQIESILMHLGSAELDPVESAIVTFARGTIRGRPMQLQQHCRALFQQLRPEQVAEAIGTSALANAICRLGVVTQLG